MPLEAAGQCSYAIISATDPLRPVGILTMSRRNLYPFVFLLVSLTLSGEQLQACGSGDEIVSEPRPRFPVVELRSDAWGVVVVEFTVLPDGTTANLNTLFYNSAAFERSALVMISEASFAERGRSCSLTLAVELVMDNREWTVNFLPAPEQIDDPEFQNWVATQSSLYYGDE